MKVWFGYGSEHSMNLVMIGRFKEVRDAVKAQARIERLTTLVASEMEAGRLRPGELLDHFPDHIRDSLYEAGIHTIGPAELEQFAYDVSVTLKGEVIELRTDESDVSAFLKVLLDCSGRVEVYSAHDYPDAKRVKGK